MQNIYQRKLYYLSVITLSIEFVCSIRLIIFVNEEISNKN